ncbi:MAG TPA: hypothetical protein VFI08_13050 [Spirochaetia bacterium]|nr:hypothetical protein [Spirochaetia bacterium]
MDRKPLVQKQVRGRNVYYTVSWSRLAKSSKYEIVKSVPSEAGIYELYYKDFHGKLCLFHLGKSWYGGLRNEIRERTDVELEKDAGRRRLLDRYECWYRWSLVSSSDDMSDLLFFFASTYLPRQNDVKGSGRYERIFVNEVDADKIVTI